MLILRDATTNKDIKFSITTFPDNTSQVWKIEEDLKERSLNIIWMYENEAEFIHLLQLIELVKHELKGSTYKELPFLYIPYFPYARQDKEISNKSTWSKNLIADLLFRALNYQPGLNISTFDIHSFNADSENCIWTSGAAKFHNAVVDHDIIVFPDKGAATRYDHFPAHKVMYCDKVRNQLTGEIEGLTLVNPVDLQGMRVAIVDDICDGGRTFIEVAKALRNYHPKQIDLVVSHGIFSKGLDVLYEAGIYKIFTTNSLLQNKPQNTAKLCVHEIIEINYPVLDKSAERYIRKMI